MRALFAFFLDGFDRLLDWMIGPDPEVEEYRKAMNTKHADKSAGGRKKES